MADEETPLPESESESTYISIPVSTLSGIDSENVIYHVELSSVEDVSCLENCVLQFTSGDSTVIHDEQGQNEIINQSDDSSKVLVGSCNSETSAASTQTGRKRGRKRKEGIDLKCNVCGKEYDCLKKMTTHKKYHSDKRPHVCTVVECGKAFKMMNDLERHMRIHTNSRPYQCSYCDMRFTQNGSRKVHERLHTGDKPYKCSDCGNSFAQKGDLTSHKVKHTNDRNFKCEVCGMTFKHKKALNRHKKLHQLREFQCEFCLREYVEKYDLMRHKKICKNKAYINSSKESAEFLDNENKNLGKNSQETTNNSNSDLEIREISDKNHEKSTQCQVCGKQCNYPSCLKTHMRSHMRSHMKGSYRRSLIRKSSCLCEICGKSLGTKLELDRHVSLHTGEAPYFCPCCEERFHNGKELTDHINLYCENRKYRCEICNRRYQMKKTFKKHMKTHFQDNVLNCELCGKQSGDQREKILHCGEHMDQLFTKSGIKSPENTNMNNYIKILYQLLQEKGILQQENRMSSQEKEILQQENGMSPQEKGSLQQENGTLSHEKGILQEHGMVSHEKGILQAHGMVSHEKGILQQEKETLSPEKGTLLQEEGTLLVEKETLSPEKETLIFEGNVTLSQERDDDEKNLKEKEKMFRTIVQELYVNAEIKSVVQEMMAENKPKVEIQQVTTVLRRSNRKRKQSIRLTDNIDNEDLCHDMHVPFNKSSKSIQDSIEPKLTNKIGSYNSRKKLKLDENSHRDHLTRTRKNKRQGIENDKEILLFQTHAIKENLRGTNGAIKNSFKNESNDINIDKSCNQLHEKGDNLIEKEENSYDMGNTCTSSVKKENFNDLGDKLDDIGNNINEKGKNSDLKEDKLNNLREKSYEMEDTSDVTRENSNKRSDHSYEIGNNSKEMGHNSCDLNYDHDTEHSVRPKKKLTEKRKAHQCQKCGKEFHMKCVLKKHEQMCKDGETFVTQSKQYSEKSGEPLKMCNVTKGRDLRFKCSFCDKEYKHKIFLDLHITRFHKIKTPSSGIH